MTTWTMIKKILKNPLLIRDYFQGEGRYTLYTSKFRWLLPTHIVEQFEYRTMWMEPACYENGACSICGCETPALQFANKSCDKPCYPPIMNRKDWKRYKNYEKVFISDTSNKYWVKSMLTGRPLHYQIVLGPYDNPVHQIISNDLPAKSN